MHFEKQLLNLLLLIRSHVLRVFENIATHTGNTKTKPASRATLAGFFMPKNNMTEIEKKVIDVEVPFDFEWTGGVDIQKMRNDLDELERLGVNKIYISSDSEYDHHFVEIGAYIEREETDEEFESRKEGLFKNEIAQMEAELQQLKRLQEKYRWMIGVNY